MMNSIDKRKKSLPIFFVFRFFMERLKRGSVYINRALKRYDDNPTILIKWPESSGNKFNNDKLIVKKVILRVNMKIFKSLISFLLKYRDPNSPRHINPAVYALPQ